MPSELIKRIDLDLMYLPFVQKYLEVLAACQKKGVTYYAISGTRTLQEQASLYAQGRTAPGQIVTNAKPGTSAHNWGVAADSCRDKDAVKAGLQPSWNLEDYQVLAEEGVRQGLEAAYYWKTFQEGPHLQLPLSKYSITFATLKRVHDQGQGMKSVFAYLDQFKW